MKIANQLILKWGDCPGFREGKFITRLLKSGRKESEGNVTMGERQGAGLEDGEREAGAE